MRKRWYAFSECVPEDGGKAPARTARAFAGLAAGLTLLASVNARAVDPSPTPVPEPLPTYGVERVTGEPGREIRVGDTVQFRITGWPATRENKDGGVPSRVEPVSATPPLDEQGWHFVSPQPTDSGGSVRLTPEPVFEGVPLKGGRLRLPPLIVVDSNGNKIGRTQEVDVSVESALKGENDKPVELIAPVGMAFPWWVIAVLAALVLLVLVTAFFLIRRWMRARRKRAEVPPPAGPPKPEDEAALDALKELEEQGLWLRGQHKKHFFGVSEIFKAYLGRRYGFDALECTSSELIRTLETLAGEAAGNAPAEDVIDRVESLFNALDLVKFTDQVPTEDEGVRVVAEARKLVLATRRPKMAPPAMAGAPRQDTVSTGAAGTVKNGQ